MYSYNLVYINIRTSNYLTNICRYNDYNHDE